jgi:hypothetical protein
VCSRLSVCGGAGRGSVPLVPGRLHNFIMDRGQAQEIEGIVP